MGPPSYMRFFCPKRRYTAYTCTCLISCNNNNISCATFPPYNLNPASTEHARNMTYPESAALPTQRHEVLGLR